MGQYINNLPDGTPLKAKGKAQALMDDGAIILDGAPTEWREGIVAVRNNGPFEAAAYAFDQSELDHFRRDDRGVTWLYYSRAKEVAQ